jgi:hypothetical protein
VEHGAGSREIPLLQRHHHPVLPDVEIGRRDREGVIERDDRVGIPPVESEEDAVAPGGAGGTRVQLGGPAGVHQRRIHLAGAHLGSGERAEDRRIRRG